MFLNIDFCRRSIQKECKLPAIPKRQKSGYQVKKYMVEGTGIRKYSDRYISLVDHFYDIPLVHRVMVGWIL